MTGSDRTGTVDVVWVTGADVSWVVRTVRAKTLGHRREPRWQRMRCGR